METALPTEVARHLMIMIMIIMMMTTTISKGVFREEKGHAPNGDTLIAEKHFDGCFSGYFQLYLSY